MSLEETLCLDDLNESRLSKSTLWPRIHNDVTANIAVLKGLAGCIDGEEAGRFQSQTTG